jgi:uncharacterized membrane protein
VRYKNEYAAQENVQTLRKLDRDWIVDIHDAVAVARDADGKLHIQDSFQPTSKTGAGWGVLIGTILGGLALAPLTGGLSAAAAAGTVAAGAVGGAAVGGIGGSAIASWDKQSVGLSEDFVSEVSDTIKPGQSAIFALVGSSNPDRVLAYFRGTGGKIIQTNLSPYEQERVQQILSGMY